VDLEVPAAVGVDPGIHATEQHLRHLVQGTTFSVIDKNLETPVSELDIPLCRMIPMTDVRTPLQPDIEKLKAEFVNGYKRGGPCFYVALKSYKLETQEVTDEERSKWSPNWKAEDNKFEDSLKLSPELMKFSNKKFYIWDGNHRHLAWMPVIEQFHYDNPDFHVAARSTILNVTSENNQQLLNAMTQWNKYASKPYNGILSYAWILFIHFLINAFQEERSGPRRSALDS
jgi:hypothetical protein